MRLNLFYFPMAITLAACTSYIWNPPDEKKFQEIMDAKVGQSFASMESSRYERDLLIESESFQEYLFDRYNKCSWIVRVEKKTNIIQSWRYSKPEICRRP